MSYAILMRKEKIIDNFYFFKPIMIMEGEIIENALFELETGEYFFNMLDKSFLYSDEQECYGYSYSEDELKERYQATDLEEAIEEYKNDIFSRLNVVAINTKAKKEIIYCIPFEGILGLIDDEEKKEFENTSLLTDTSEDYIEDKELEDKSAKDYSVAIKKEESKNDNIRKDIDSEGLEAFLKERIKNQDRQIEELVTIISDNYKTYDRHLIERPLIIGPSGVGKTETLTLMAEYLKIPFVKFSTPNLSASGYVGNNIEDVLKLAYINSSKNIEKCQESLIFFDEFDKIAKRGHDISDEAVQNLLLTFLDGMEYDVPASLGYNIKMDTTFMNIVLGGAFYDLLEHKKKHLGFTTSDVNETTNLTDEDLINYGYTPEIIGRANPKIFYNKLEKEHLKEILKASKLSPIYLKQKFYKEVYNIDLIYDDDYIKKITELADKSNTGARNLKTLVFRSLVDVSHTLQDKSNRGIFSEVHITGETVEDNKVYILKRK